MLAAIGITGAVAAAITSAVTAVALSVATKSVMNLVAGTPSAKNGGTPSIFRQTITDSFIVYGTRRVGGMLAFFHARVVGKDHYRYFVVAVAGHRCQGVLRWFLNDEEVTVDGSGKVTSGAYANAAWLWFQRGLASETANATFVSECGGKWTAAHKGNGIAAIYAKFKMTDAVVQAGMPNMTAEIEGRDEILDPRDASTGYTNNAILVAYDYMSIPREEGGFGAYTDEIPDDDWISAQANVCDEVVGGEARYAIDAVITTGSPPSEIRDALIVNMAGSYAYSGGKFLIRPGYWVPASVTLSESDLAGPIQVSPFLGLDQAANQVQGSFIDPGALYQGAPFDTQTAGSPASLNQLDLDLAFCTSKARANRVASIMLNRAQAEKTVVWPANIVGLEARALDTVQFGTSRYSLSNYAFQVTAWALSSDYGIVITGREENEDIYAEPAAASSSSAPAIAVATPVRTEQEISQLIGESSTRPTRVLSASETGGVATITVLAHDRVYPGGTTVSIPMSTHGGLLTDTPYYPYYIDGTLADTAPTIIITDDSGEAQGVVGAHPLGRIRTPVTASGITYVGGGAYTPGGTVGREIEP